MHRSVNHYQCKEKQISFLKWGLFKIRVGPLTGNPGTWFNLLSCRVQCAPHVENIETISIVVILIDQDGN